MIHDLRDAAEQLLYEWDDQEDIKLSIEQLRKAVKESEITEDQLRSFLSSSYISVEELAITTLLELLNGTYTLEQMREEIC